MREAGCFLKLPAFILNTATAKTTTFFAQKIFPAKYKKQLIVLWRQAFANLLNARIFSTSLIQDSVISKGRSYRFQWYKIKN